MMQLPVPPPGRRVATPLALAIVSLVAATALWVAVTDAENPAEVRQFNAAIPIEPINVPQGLAVASLSQQAVSIHVSSSEDTFKELTTANFVARIDLAGVQELFTTSLVNVEVVDREDDVDIAETTPQFVEVTLEQETTKQVPVQVNRNGSPLPGYVVTALEANPLNVRVRGASSRIQQVESAAIDVNLTGLRTNLEAQYRLTARDGRGADIGGVILEPASAQVNVALQQREISVPVAVQPQVRGSVGEGYQLNGVSVEPLVVSVTGSQDAVQAVTSVSTEPIDISGITNDITRTVRLQLPANVRPATGRDSVSVSFNVKPAQGERVFAVAPEVDNVSNNLRAMLQTTAVNVTIRGEEPALRRLAPGAVRVRVNASGLPEGVHVVNAEVALPEGVTLISFDPPQVILILRP
jgi:YbbR domain-containing protein